MIVFAFVFFAASVSKMAPRTDWKLICASGAGKDAYSCAEHELVSVERRLAKTYKDMLGQLPDEDEWDKRKTKAQLIAAQNAWLAFRDANCDFQGGQEGGANDWVSVMSTDCKIDETKKRIDYLKHYSALADSR